MEIFKTRLSRPFAEEPIVRPRELGGGKLMMPDATMEPEEGIERERERAAGGASLLPALPRRCSEARMRNNPGPTPEPELAHRTALQSAFELLGSVQSVLGYRRQRHRRMSNGRDFESDVACTSRRKVCASKWLGLGEPHCVPEPRM